MLLSRIRSYMRLLVAIQIRSEVEGLSADGAVVASFVLAILVVVEFAWSAKRLVAPGNVALEKEQCTVVFGNAAGGLQFGCWRLMRWRLAGI